MVRIRKHLALAAALNTLVFVSEAWAGARANSLSLLMDAAHNFSDELALICLFLAYMVTSRASRGFQRTANLLNGLGLILLSVAICWQAVERLLHPEPVTGWLPMAVGAFGVVGNWCVARLLRPWAKDNATIRLAYLHNRGDMIVSFAPVLAGVLVLLTHLILFDALFALGTGVWLLFATIHEIRHHKNDLIWPEVAVSAQSEQEAERP